MERYTVDLDEPLSGDFDPDALIERVPSWYRVKGVYMSPLADALTPADWDELSKSLDQAPRRRRYMAIRDYPQRDFTRLWLTVAAQRFGDVSRREQARRIARADVKTFLSSKVGRVVVALVRDATGAVLKIPQAYQLSAKGQSADAVRLGDGLVRVRIHNEPGISEYALGQLEGMVLHYEATSRIHVEVDGHRKTYDVEVKTL